MVRRAREIRFVPPADGAEVGVALLDVLVALGVLAIAVLGVAASLDGAIRSLGAAAAARRALRAAQATAHTSVAATSGWQAVPGADGFAPGGPDAAIGEPLCQRRTTRSVESSGVWFWVEVRCAPQSAAGRVGPGPVGAARPFLLAVPR